jgi:hypothetical protein
MLSSFLSINQRPRRGNTAAFLLVASCLVLGVGCATSYQPPRTVPQVPKNQVIASDIETVWRGVIRYFADRNVPIENLDHSSYFIKTKAPLARIIRQEGGVQFSGDTIALENEWCDCGVAKITNVWETTSRISVSYNLVLNKTAADQTEVVMNVFFTGAYYGKRNRTIPGYDVELPLECISKGVLERGIIDYLRTFK